MDILKSYFGLPTSGVIGIVNNRNKRVLIVSSIRLKDALFRTLGFIENEVSDEYRHMKEDKDDLEVVILDTELHEREIGIRYWAFVEGYEKEGWTLYSRNTRMPKWEVKVITTIGLYTIPKAEVVLENRRGGRIVVGEFTSLEKAEKWKEENYSNGVNRIILLEE